MEIGRQLRYERQQRGWSQARVAEVVGTDASTVSRWERNVSIPSPYFREQLCELYDRAASDLGFVKEERKEEARQGGVLTANEIPFVSRLLASASYGLGWVTGIPILLFNRTNHFVLFHSLQAILFFGSLHVIVMICSSASPNPQLSPLIRNFFSLGGGMTVLIGLIAWSLVIIRSAQGKYHHLPLVGTVSARIATALATSEHQEQPG